MCRTEIAFILYLDIRVDVIAIKILSFDNVIEDNG